MKKHFLVLAAASAVVFAACNGGNTEGSLTKEQADSMAQAKLDSAEAALRAQNDSIIAAEAAEKLRIEDSIRVADSIFNAGKKSGTTTVIKKNTTPAKQPQQPTAPVKPAKEEPVKQGGLKGKSDQAKQEQVQQSGGGLRSKSDQAKQEQSSQGSGGGLRSKSDQAKQ